MSVRESIVATLLSVTDIGAVNTYPRYAKQLSEMMLLYCSPAHKNQLRGWHVKRLSMRESGAIYESTVQAERWLIEGFMALSDEAESGIVFDQLIDAIRDKFRGETFDNTVQLTDPSDETAYIQIEQVDEVMFAGVLCHRARLILPVIQTVSPGA
jgi:hypothetical protein